MPSSHSPEPGCQRRGAKRGVLLRPLGLHTNSGTLTLFIQVSDIEASYASLNTHVKVVMPLEKKWYGVTEFAFEDPDGYLITFAEQ